MRALEVLKRLLGWPASSRVREINARLLTLNEQAEERHMQEMIESRDAGAIDFHLSAILAHREERVTILRQLGMRDEADSLARDNAERRAWIEQGNW